MSSTWDPTGGLAMPRITAMGWLRVALRAPPVVGVLLGGVAVTLILRLVERPVFGPRRPVTAFITQWVCRIVLFTLGLRLRRQGRPMTGQGAVVANHSSWLDIFVLNARKRVYFVSKAEVASWPGIGFLARLVDTVFIARDPRRAADQVAVFKARLASGHKLLFFPEGTSTDNQRVLAFKPTLFQAFFDEALRGSLRIQSVSVAYQVPRGVDARFYNWWGDMDFGPHALQVLAARRGGRVQLVYHSPVAVADFADRKALALALEETVRGGMPPDRQRAD